jgi:hypothetical protein
LRRHAAARRKRARRWIVELARLQAIRKAWRRRLLATDDQHFRTDQDGGVASPIRIE